MNASIAFNRLGFGARPDEAPPGDPRHWLVQQLARYDAKLPAVAAALIAGAASVGAQPMCDLVRA